MLGRRHQQQQAVVLLRLAQLPEAEEIVGVGLDFLSAEARHGRHDELDAGLRLEIGKLALQRGAGLFRQHGGAVDHAAAQRRKIVGGLGERAREQKREEQRERAQRSGRHRRRPPQNFTFGAACDSASAVNSAIGFSLRNTVEAQITLGNVRSDVLNACTAAM